MKRLVLSAVLVALLAASGCGGSTAATSIAAQSATDVASVDTHPSVSPEPGTTPATPFVHETSAPMEPPPPVIVRAGDRVLELRSHAFAYRGYFGHDAIPEPLPDAGATDEIVVDYGADWTFEATFQATGRPSARRQTVPLERNDAGTLTLLPAGRAGSYDIRLEGRSYGVGSLSAVFRWTTPVDGPLPTPDATLAVVSEIHGVVEGYGASLDLSNLRRTPKSASATVTVTSSEGKVTALQASRETATPRSALLEGSLFLSSPGVWPTTKYGSAPAEALERLGTGPFRYDVELLLDGVHHTASARWPADELPDDQLRVRLNFAPPLPALE